MEEEKLKEEEGEPMIIEAAPGEETGREEDGAEPNAALQKEFWSEPKIKNVQDRLA